MLEALFYFSRLATSTSISLQTVTNCNLGFGILIVSHMKLNPSHGLHSLSESQRGDFSMMILLFFILV